MNLTLTVLEITAPVFLLAAIGFGWVRLGFEYRVQFVTRLAMTLAVPCLVFTALMRTEIDPAALATLSLAAFAAYALAWMDFKGRGLLIAMVVGLLVVPLPPLWLRNSLVGTMASVWPG